ncbi:MAG TPA: hypothetical protein VFT85_08360 [Acidimicrobiia bacterium]|nr:hypothetical protein [Acidimicrobiia bacterium]
MKRDRRRPTIGDIWKLALAVIGAIAIAQELRKPPDERTWHGKVGDVVPYDFRLPTVERVRLTYWNPDGPLLSGKAFGVGWAFNFGALFKLADRNRSSDEPETSPEP